MKWPVHGRRLARASLWAAFASACLLASLYWTFPVEAVRQRLVHEVGRASGGAWQLQVGSINTYRLSGVSADDVQLTRVHAAPGAWSGIKLAAIHARLRLMPLIVGTRSVDLALLWGARGAINLRLTETSAQVNDGRGERGGGGSSGSMPAGQAELDVQQLDLATPATLADLFGTPMAGVLRGHVDLTSVGQIRKLNGGACLEAAGLQVGPGSVAGLALPAIDLGHVCMDWEIKDGRAKVINFKQEGGSVTLRASGWIDMAATMGLSRAELCLQFRPTAAFLMANPKMQSIFSLVQAQLKKDTEGFLHVPLAGQLNRLTPQPGLCRHGR